MSVICPKKTHAQQLMTMKITDISAAIPGCRVYPGDPTPSVTKLSDAEKDGYSLSAISLCSHSGTHVDAPSHFINGGYGADGISLYKCMGECLVTDDADAALAAARRQKRIILKGCDINAEQARMLAESKIDLIGTDALSFGKTCDEQEDVHKTLLGAGVVMLEGLCLSEVDCGTYTLVALPLKLIGCDGSPVRAVLLS